MLSKVFNGSGCIFGHLRKEIFCGGSGALSTSSLTGGIERLCKVFLHFHHPHTPSFKTSSEKAAQIPGVPYLLKTKALLSHTKSICTCEPDLGPLLIMPPLLYSVWGEYTVPWTMYIQKEYYVSVWQGMVWWQQSFRNHGSLGIINVCIKIPENPKEAHLECHRRKCRCKSTPKFKLM